VEGRHKSARISQASNLWVERFSQERHANPSNPTYQLGVNDIDGIQKSGEFTITLIVQGSLNAL
jgi:hypothetical protein